jgi:ribonucleoside-diphosphate reductase alpha chain
MTEKEWLGDNQLSLDIWHKKYQINNENFEEWLDRVSGGNSYVRQLIKDKKFLFGGRILASRGVTDRKVTYSNCYVIAPPNDNIESIFEAGRKLARTYSYGGGCGIDISNLRPKNAIVHNAAKSTSGAISFMDFYSYITGLIGQSGRRGALMISIDCKHPDIEEFINLKTKQGVCEKANISIRVSDGFMQAAIDDRDWITEFTSRETGTITRTFRARDLLKLLAKRNWEWAEPGLLYWDRITGYNMLNNDGNFAYAGVNPCAEEPLPAGGSCLLGSINLSEFVTDPFTDKANVDWDGLKDAVAIAVLGLNEVLNEGMMLHPLNEQRESVKNWRQMGLGTMGLADMLIKLGVTYGSVGAIKVTESVYETIARSAVMASLEFAKTDGCYPMCKKEKLVDSSFIKALNLPYNMIEDIRTYGLHNSQLLTCAPTGSIATMLQVSTGVEPNFALKYTRKTQSLNDKDTYYEVFTKIVQNYYDSFSINGKFRTRNVLPDYFVESKDIAPIDRIKMQAVLQKYTDASISSTINLPNEATVDDIYNIYVEAWKNGLKGVTIYRAGCNREGILTVKKPESIPITGAPKRPTVLPCDINKIKVKGENFIVCVGLHEGKPYEVFVFRLKHNVELTDTKGEITKVKKGVYNLYSKDLVIANLLNTDISVEEKAATLYSSMLLRHGVNIKYIIKTAKKVNDNITSFSSAMCRVLAKYTPVEVEGKCPDCGADLVHEGGCIHCSQCSYSKCE